MRSWDFNCSKAWRFKRPVRASRSAFLRSMFCINDNYGHDVGDQALIKVARLLDENFRKVDYVLRIGGGEFAVIMEVLLRVVQCLIRLLEQAVTESLFRKSDSHADRIFRENRLVFRVLRFYITLYQIMKEKSSIFFFFSYNYYYTLNLQANATDLSNASSRKTIRPK